MSDPITIAAATLEILKISTQATSAVLKKLSSRKVTREELDEIAREVDAIQTSLFKSQETILDMKAALLEARQENLSLREEIRSAQGQVRAAESRTLEREQHKLVQVGKSTVVVREGEEGIYYCPTCFGKGHVTPIQPFVGQFQVFGTHNCAVCKTHFNLR